MDLLEVFESLNPEPTTRGNPGPERSGQPTRRRVPLAAAAVILLVGIAVVFLVRGRDSGPIDVASIAAETETETETESAPVAGQPPLTATSVPSDWQANDIGGDAPATRELWQAETEANRYASLVNHAGNVLQVSCLASVGIERPDINILATRGRARPRLDFELAPFASNGGYSLTHSRVGIDTTIGPEANALSAQYGAYVDSLSGDDLVRHEAAVATCRDEGRTAIFGATAASEDFYRLVNIAINLPLDASRLVAVHNDAKIGPEQWRQCMSAAGHQVLSRDDAIESALAERYAGSNTPAVLPGPTEIAVSRADRLCSAEFGYTRARAAALGAAERYLLTHDERVRGFFVDWNALRPQLHASLERILGAEVVAFHLGSEHVATGEPVDEYFPTRASFEQAFLAELVRCAEAAGMSATEALDPATLGSTGWWLLSTIEADRARIAEEGSGVLRWEPGQTRDTDDDLIVGCGAEASRIVSPKQRVENDKVFIEFFAARDEELQFTAGVNEEWSRCMQARGFDLATVAANQERSFELLQRVNAGELDEAEALRIDIGFTTSYFECSLDIDHGERVRIFSEETAEAFLAQQ